MSTKKILTSKCKKFPFNVIRCADRMPSLEEWLGVSEDDLTDEMYDDNIDSYEEIFCQFTLNKTAVFNLEEWIDIDSFDHDSVQKAFDKVYNKSYCIKVSSETWDEDCTYNHYALRGTLDIEADDKFYDDVAKIDNEYVRNRILGAFNAFLQDLHEGLDSYTDNKWEIDNK